jgi:hypothetical protein
MELLLIIAAFVLLPIAVALGFGVDSRDHATWSPQHGGRRMP